MFFLMQTLWDCFKRRSLFYGLIWLPGQHRDLDLHKYFHTSLNLWWKWKSDIGLWIFDRWCAGLCKSHWDEHWLQNIDWSSAWARDNVITWVCLCYTQVPVEETSSLAFISRFGSPRFPLVLGLSSLSGSWLKLESTSPATERESLSQDIWYLCIGSSIRSLLALI